MLYIFYIHMYMYYTYTHYNIRKGNRSVFFKTGTVFHSEECMVTLILRINLGKSNLHKQI